MIENVNRLDGRCARGRPLLTCYFPIGDLLFDDEILALYAEAGVDMLELGVPSTHPFMDGSDVADSMARTIAAGSDVPARLRHVAGWLRADPSRPAGICMAYPDIDFPATCPADTLALLDGLLLLGLDDREDRAAIAARCEEADVRMVRFVPTRATDTDFAAARAATGYIMLQAAAGVTGPRTALDPENRERLAALRDAGVTRPILLGFGLSSAEQVSEAMAMGANGVIIGSMCIRMARRGQDALFAFLQAMREALDG